MNPYPNLKALRLQHSYKQEYVADLLGIGQPEYSKIETGQRKIDNRMVKELCKLYDVEIDVLLKQNPTPLQLAAEHNLQFAANPAVNNDVLNKLLDSYNALLDNLARQQQTQEKMIDQLIKTKEKNDEAQDEPDDAPQPKQKKFK
jgi:transcriptional regulator with XRE-family HTH domain